MENVKRRSCRNGVPSTRILRAKSRENKIKMIGELGHAAPLVY